jgi:hypothetical protein
MLFGIIGSAMMPVSDLFPRAGITFWDWAHEANGGLMCDGYSRVTGRIAMAIAPRETYARARARQGVASAQPEANVARRERMAKGELNVWIMRGQRARARECGKNF